MSPIARWFCLSLGTFAVLVAPAAADEPFSLADGDRVVLVGNTVVERAQRYGHVELALATAFAARDVTFRNLGWSGDTVFGEARAGFDTPKEGRERLIEQVQAARPTVLLVGYGANAAFDGVDAIPRFVEGLNSLLDTWAPLGARTVLLGPLDHENLGAPLPDPGPYNESAAKYRDAIRGIAEERGFAYVELQAELSAVDAAGPLTDNCVHLTGDGYRALATALVHGLTNDDRAWRLDVDAAGATAEATATRLSGIDGYDDRMVLRIVDACGFGIASSSRWLRVRGLPYERYTLVCDGRELATASADQWAEGVRFEDGVVEERADALRAAIVEKNRLFFYRWRPQNITYLFGFRKHEQGQNAVEVPQFDEHVAEAEAAIEAMRQPVKRTYVLRRAG